MNPNPLVTLILVSYNQEKFICDAVKGALAQTYSPLEIIISDDSSKDRTFELIQEISNQYQGPHKIITHRTDRNLGLCGNLNKALELSSGELIITTAGDDVCYPNRCQSLVDEWMRPGRKWHSIFSNADLINEDGAPLGPYRHEAPASDNTQIEFAIRNGVAGVAGCTHAFSRQNYEIFGPLPEKAPGEDEILGFRSLLLGGIRWIPDKLIAYRKHSGGLYKDRATLKRMSRDERIAAIHEDKMSCEIRRTHYREYIERATASGFIPGDLKIKFLDLLENRHPYYIFTIECKRSAAYAGFQLLLIMASGRYRSGMITYFKHTFIPFGIRTLIKRALGPQRLNITEQPREGEHKTS